MTKRITWLRVFDDDDLRDLLGELAHAHLVAAAEHSTELANDVLRAWRTTAATLDDPLQREILLGTYDANDFVEVSSPT